MKTFTSSTANKSAPIPLTLDGVDYTFQPGKKAHALMALLVQDTKSQSRELDRISQLLSWFSHGLNKDHNKKHDSDNPVEGCQACDVQRRLFDTEDDLDFDTVIEATTWLIGESTGPVPTT